MASRSEEVLNERNKKIKETQAVAFDKLGEVIELGADKAVVAALTETVKNFDDNIKSLVAAARERLEIAARHQQQYDALRSAQAEFVAAATPAMLDAQIQINAILGSAMLSQDDATQVARTIDQLGNAVASGNLMASEMTAALSANGSQTLEAIEKEFKAAQARVKSNLDLLPQNSTTRALKDAALKLLALGEGKTGVFKIRQKELDANDYGQLVLEKTRKLNVGLGISVQQTGQRRAERDRRLDLAGPQGDLARDHRHACARRPHFGRFRAVRLALCRPQHPAPDQQSATLDAASVGRRPRVGNLSHRANATRLRRWRIRCRFSARA